MFHENTLKNYIVLITTFTIFYIECILYCVYDGKKFFFYSYSRLKSCSIASADLGWGGGGGFHDKQSVASFTTAAAQQRRV